MSSQLIPPPTFNPTPVPKEIPREVLVSEEQGRYYVVPSSYITPSPSVAPIRLSLRA